MKVKILNSILINLPTIYFIYLNIKEKILFDKLEILIEKKRECEIKAFSSFVRKDVALVIEKDQNYHIFNKFLENKQKAILYVNKYNKFYVSQKILIGAAKTYFILSDKMHNLKDFENPNNVELEVHNINLKFENYINHEILNIMKEMNKLLKESHVLEYKKAEIKFKKVLNKNYIYYKFESAEIGSIESTEYYKKNDFMEKIKNILNGLITKKFSSKNEFLDEIVKNLLNLCEEENIFKEKVDLELYPDLIAVLFPYQFVSISTNYWTPLSIVKVGVDFRKIKENGLSNIFNLPRVEELIKKGDCYIYTTQYFKY